MQAVQYTQKFKLNTRLCATNLTGSLLASTLLTSAFVFWAWVNDVVPVSALRGISTLSTIPLVKCSAALACGLYVALLAIEKLRAPKPQVKMSLSPSAAAALGTSWVVAPETGSAAQGTTAQSQVVLGEKEPSQAGSEGAEHNASSDKASGDKVEGDKASGDKASGEGETKGGQGEPPQAGSKGAKREASGEGEGAKDLEGPDAGAEGGGAAGSGPGSAGQAGKGPGALPATRAVDCSRSSVFSSLQGGGHVRVAFAQRPAGFGTLRRMPARPRPAHRVPALCLARGPQAAGRLGRVGI